MVINECLELQATGTRGSFLISSHSIVGDTASLGHGSLSSLSLSKKNSDLALLVDRESPLMILPALHLQSPL